MLKLWLVTCLCPFLNRPILAAQPQVRHHLVNILLVLDGDQNWELAVHHTRGSSSLLPGPIQTQDLSRAREKGGDEYKVKFPHCMHIVLTGYYFYRADTDKHTRMIHTHAHTDSTSIRNASHKMHDVVVTSLALPQTLTHSQTTPLVIHSSSHGVQ